MKISLENERNFWANRKSRYYFAKHVLDEGHKYGYDYHDKLIKRSVSPIFYDDPQRTVILQTFDYIICYIIDQIKMIKKFRNYAIDKRNIRMR